MITIDEAWELMEACNERAHQEAWDYWTKADETENDDEEELREIASEVQRECFWDEMASLEPEEEAAILHYARTDQDFRDQFEAFNGPLDDEDEE